MSVTFVTVSGALFGALSAFGVVVVPLDEAGLIERLEEGAAWQVAIRPGSTLAGVNEVAIDSDGAEPVTANYDSHQIEIVDILDVFEEQATVTPFFLSYTAEGELVFGIGPTQGFTTTIELAIPEVSAVSTITVLGEIRNVSATTHVRLNDLFFNTAPFSGIDINGDPALPGTRPVQGFDLVGFDSQNPWTIFGELEVEYAGDPPVPGNDEYTIVIMGSQVPEPSVAALLVCGLFFFRRCRC